MTTLCTRVNKFFFIPMVIQLLDSFLNLNEIYLGSLFDKADLCIGVFVEKGKNEVVGIISFQ